MFKSKRFLSFFSYSNLNANYGKAKTNFEPEGFWWGGLKYLVKSSSGTYMYLEDTPKCMSLSSISFF